MTRRRSRILATTGVAVLVLVAVTVAARPFSGNASRPTVVVPTALARIVRTDVVERQQVSGTLSYSGSYGVANAGAAGTVTWLPQPGTIVGRGRELYELDHAPVTLLYGPRPAYRDLTYGIAGPDVLALQRNLLALGFPGPVDGRFDFGTLAAVEAWQRSLGMPATGTLALGEVVFLPGPTRIATLVAAAGAPVAAGGPVLTATSAQPAVLIPLDPGTVSQLSVGDQALVTTPDGRTVTGHVSSIGRVATAPPNNQQGGGGGGSATVPVTVTLPAGGTGGGLDQAPVQVAIVSQEDRNVLAAPISALLARPGGGYAVNLVSGGVAHLTPVTTGLFDDVAGKVEISGPGIAAGERVQVPTG
ncbi:MAG: peptidoglycan-binding protein [Actinobacteria bacterium]|nr:peptidoglycan-binding protein [Actinomycetota bacterium]